MVDDKIDIEEHDILDNPVIRRMFPDISLLKKEVLEFDDEVTTKQIPVKDNAQNTEKYPTVVINETNNITEQVLKYPTIIIDGVDNIAEQAVKYQTMVIDLTTNIEKQAATYPTIVIDGTDNIVKQAEKYQTLVIDETDRIADQAVKYSMRVIDGITNIAEEAVSYPTIVIDGSNGSLPCLLHESADKDLNANSSENRYSPKNSNYQNDNYRSGNRERIKRHANNTHLGKSSDITKAVRNEVKSVSKSCQLNSINETSNINEKKANESNMKAHSVTLSKSVQKTFVLPEQESKHGFHPARNLLHCSKKDESVSENTLTVISSAKSNCADEIPLKKSTGFGIDVNNSPIKEFVLPWKGNKIILGSKSTAINTHSESCEKQSILSNVKVVVENLETFLSKSSRYCKTCLTLFPSNKTLADHKNFKHSQTHNSQSSNVKKSGNVTKRYKCNVCEKSCSSSSNLLRHKRCVHFLNIKKRIRKKIKFHNVQPHAKLNEEANNLKCSHCDNSFTSQQVLIDHMYSVLQSNSQDLAKSTKNVNFARKKLCAKSRVFYRCPLCSYYFKQRIMFAKHMKNEHMKINNIKLERVVFDPVCKYCSKEYSNVQSFNVHVWKYHQKQRKLWRHFPKMNVGKDKKIVKSRKEWKLNTKKLQLSSINHKKHPSKDKDHHIANKEQNTHKKYLLKSTVFKCIKCDVCFLSGNKAADHNEHADAMTNWKCLKCLHIFKVEEQIYHTQQHLFEDHFEVVKICENSYFYLLYKCTNCASYFHEKDFFTHYSICEIQSPDSAYCKICHILIDNKIKKSHDMQHKMLGGKELNNILVESDVIIHNEGAHNNIKKAFDLYNKQSEDKLLNNTSQEQANKKTQETKLNHTRLRKNELRKSLVSEDVHVYNEGTNSIKNIGEEESLLERNENTRNNSLVPKKRNVKKITKPLRFIYCSTCKCFIFVSKVRKLYSHIKAHCINVTNYVCKYCGLVLSTKTIDSHRKLHQNMPTLTLTDFKFYDLQNGKEMYPPVPKYPNCHLCEKHFVMKTSILSHLCDEDYLKCPLCQIKLSNAAFPLHMSFHNYRAKNKSQMLNESNLKDVSAHSKESHPISTKTTNILDSNKRSENKYQLVYICKICKVTVDTYDRVIEHCHYHFSSQEKEILTKPCDSCNLIVDVTCFDKHKMLHSSNQNKKFSVLTYDAFYVTAEDKVWLNHLFGSLSKKEIDHILVNSVYNFERKIKMQIVQDGLSYLTIYKCAKCNSFIDPSLLYEHCQRDILCYKSELVPCSICGVVFMSKEFLIKHEKIHETQDVTIRSYRIVIFNRNEDKSVNRVLGMPRQYVLYECRNCNGIVDKKQFQYHKCDFGDISKCSHCGLLLYNNDYMAHVVKHKEFCSYHENNIVVILLGAIKDEGENKYRLKPSFRGIKLDYLVYKCNKCQVCFKDKQSNHECAKSSALTKCLPCELYFEDTLFNNHRKLHECELYFSRENLTVVELSLKYSRPSDADVIIIDDEEDLQNIDRNAFGKKKVNNATDNVDYPETVIEKYDVIFRCSCGLHFLNEVSALSHNNLSECGNSRSLKQSCPKCGLLFKPNILYSHLLKHHGSKTVSYKFNIIQISK